MGWYGKIPWLGGGNSNISYFYPEPWSFMIQFDEHIFQMGWWTNHQPDEIPFLYPLPYPWLLGGSPKVPVRFPFLRLAVQGARRDDARVGPPPLNDWFSPIIWMFPKIRGKTPKRDGENNGKHYLKWMIWGYHCFRKHPYGKNVS